MSFSAVALLRENIEYWKGQTIESFGKSKMESERLKYYLMAMNRTLNLIDEAFPIARTQDSKKIFDSVVNMGKGIDKKLEGLP